MLALGICCGRRWDAGQTPYVGREVIALLDTLRFLGKSGPDCGRAQRVALNVSRSKALLLESLPGWTAKNARNRGQSESNYEKAKASNTPLSVLSQENRDLARLMGWEPEDVERVTTLVSEMQIQHGWDQRTGHSAG